MKDLGLGAEDVAKIEPLLVTYNNKGDVEGVKYDRVSVVLINAIKEQEAQLAEQKRIIESQQLQLDEQKRQIDEISRFVYQKARTARFNNRRSQTPRRK